MGALSFQYPLRRKCCSWEKWNGNQCWHFHITTESTEFRVSVLMISLKVLLVNPWNLFSLTNHILHKEWVIFVQSNKYFQAEEWNCYFFYAMFLISFCCLCICTLHKRVRIWKCLSSKHGPHHGRWMEGASQSWRLWANKRKKHAIVYLLGAPLVFGAQLPQKKQINYPHRDQKTERQE